jgi:molybdopterin-guanine dinucleotide biosynthesis protein A
MSVSAIILAGGRGSRLAGEDKGWLLFRGTALIERVVASLLPQVDQIIISCNRNQARYRRLGHSVVTDADPDFRGPLAGIAAAAAQCRGDYVLLSPCDSPQLPRDLARRLSRALQQTGADAAIPRDIRGPQYLNALLRREKMASAAAALAANELAVKRWLASMESVEVPFLEPTDSFMNINQLSDLEL